MREESQLDDMRSAIRGDFERLAERRGGQELLSVPEEPVEPVHAVVEEVVEERVDEPGEPPPRSWLDRMLGR